MYIGSAFNLFYNLSYTCGFPPPEVMTDVVEKSTLSNGELHTTPTPRVVTAEYACSIPALVIHRTHTMPQREHAITQ